ncbi:IS66 family transposase [Cupriavidus basilensis]
MPGCNWSRSRVPDGGITAKTLDYSLKNWPTLTHHLLDGEVSVDSNSLENLIRPWALGRRSWLFAGSELAGQRAAIVMSLVQNSQATMGTIRGPTSMMCCDPPANHLNSRIDEREWPKTGANPSGKGSIVY